MSIIKEYIHFFHKSSNQMMVLLWAFYLINYLRGFLLHIPIVSGFTDAIVVIFICLPIVFSMPFIIRQPVVYKCLFIYFVFCTLYILNEIVYPENLQILDKNLSRCIFTSFPFIMYGCLIDIRKYFNAFYLTSIVCIALDAFYYLIFNSNGVEVSGVEGDHNMVAAYSLLPHVLLCIVAVFRKFNLWKLGIAIIGGIMLLSYGTRGPIACLMIFIAAYLILLRRTRVKELIALGIVSILIFVFLDQIITSLLYVIGDLMGMSTRVLDRFINNDIAQDEARDWITTPLMTELKNGNRLFGYGLLGSYNFVGGYPHNFFVEVLFSFGYFVGGLLVTLLSYYIFKAFKNSSFEDRAFFLVLLCSGFMHLMFSGSFVYDADFYIFIGYIVRLLVKPLQYNCTEKLSMYNL